VESAASWRRGHGSCSGDDAERAFQRAYRGEIRGQGNQGEDWECGHEHRTALEATETEKLVQYLNTNVSAIRQFIYLTIPALQASHTDASFLIKAVRQDRMAKNSRLEAYVWKS